MDCVRALLSAGADIDAKDMFGHSVLSLATVHGHAKVIRALARHGAAIDACSERGESALIFAIADNNAECAEELILAGADTRGPKVSVARLLRGRSVVRRLRCMLVCESNVPKRTPPLTPSVGAL